MTGIRPFEVDTEELRAAGSAMVRTGDDLAASARRGLLLAEGSYGVRELDGAGARFASRFTYLVDGLGEEIANVGVHMRGSADAYEEVDAMTRQGFGEVMPY